MKKSQEMEWKTVWAEEALTWPGVDYTEKLQGATSKHSPAADLPAKC